MVTSQPFPLFVPISTERRLDHFDESVYRATPDTLLYKFVDALCGTTGAGGLVNELFLARLGVALDTIYYNDLDFIFGQIHFLARSPEESYSYDPMGDQLTSDQWDEVRTKDAWYRDRIKQFWIACGLGGTPEGIRTCINAALAVDCDLFEVWRYMDNFGLGDDLGRAPTSARNELVIRPHKDSLTPAERRIARDMLARMCPVDTIITISLDGLAVSTPVPIASAAADSEYFEVQKLYRPTPILANIPTIVFQTLPPGHLWLLNGLTGPNRKTVPVLARYSAFNITQEHSVYYLTGDNKRTVIDAVTYGTLQPNGSVAPEPNLEVFDSVEHFSNWMTYEKADSPDNYPGGKNGLHPTYAPALNADQTPYIFTWASQEAFVTAEIARITALGGVADQHRYKMPLSAEGQTKRVFWPEYAIASAPPSRDSSISSSLTARRGRRSPSTEDRDPILFVRAG